MTTTDPHHLDEEQLSSLIDERLESTDRRRVEAHLADCLRCRERLIGLRTTVELLRGLPEVEPPRSFQLAETTRRPLALRLMPWSRATGALAAALFVVLLSADLLSGLGGRTTSPRAAVPAPAAAPDGTRPAEAPRAAAPPAPAAPAQDRSTEAARSGAQQPGSAGAGPGGAAQAQAPAPPAATPQAAPAGLAGAAPAATSAPAAAPAPTAVAGPQAPTESLLRAGEVASAAVASLLLLASVVMPLLGRRPR